MDGVPLVDLAAHNRVVAPDVFRALRCLVEESDFVGGPRLANFEREFAAYTTATHAVGVSNGTDALALALWASGVGRGDEVITVAHTFIATAEAVLAVGAVPVFVDVEPGTGLMDLDRVEAAVTPRTRAVVPVHLYGAPVNLDRLMELCRLHALLLVQDAAQAHGARWAGKPLADFGDAETYSFYPGKNLGAWGDAGCLTTNREDLAATVRSLRDHGRRTGEKYVHKDLGGNFRMDPVQAVVLATKLPYLEAANARRRELYALYVRELEGVGDLRFLRPHPAATPVHHLCVVCTAARDALREYLASRRIATGIHYPMPAHLQPALSHLPTRPRLPVTERLAGEVLSLPLFPELSGSQLQRVISGVQGFFTRPRSR
jgi:dTDP-4-amino-4,6-dideoxygalactose transaminase